MGKKRIIKQKPEELADEAKTAEKTGEKAPESAPVVPVRVSGGGMRGIAHVSASYNNTLISISDDKGNVLAWSSSGALGFKGSKKATPFAAARVAEILSEKAKQAGIGEVLVLVKGVGSGRESAIRSLANHGLNITMIKDITPLPHNGPRAKKVRRV
ncbi:MAG: 30S ribosomal protein S11 [bacterium]|nr:30S ribosomal protein S11 [bacterium]